MKLVLWPVVMACVSLASSVAAGDILQWRDDTGVRHYTNVKEEVPKAQRESARVVVDEMARGAARTEGSPAGGVATHSSAPPQGLEPQHQAMVVYDRSALAEAYLAGLERGLDMRRGVGTGGGGGLRITGPLAVANAVAPGVWAPYLAPSYYPFVTTSFDRGRSRHLTLRLLLEDQFAIDRAGPFVFEERFIPPFGHPPLGLNLSPLLPRGLPHGFPPDTRVIVR
jgi:hypothetical protein